MNIEENMRLVAAKFNEYISSNLDGEPKELYEASYHLIRSGGKRMRPFMTLKTCELMGSPLERALPAAAAAEFIHNFTLVHDDIMDNDDVRHGVPTIHVKYGTPTAILAGDVLFASAFQSISEKVEGSDIDPTKTARMTKILANAALRICEGQSLDLAMASDTKMHSSLEYFQMIEKKTATLFEAACRLGTLAGGGDEESEKALASFGRNFGIAFQMVDDVLGVVGDHRLTGKPVGSDIIQGKKTYVLTMAIERTDSEGKEDVLNVFGKKKASQQEILKAVERVSSSGVADHVRNQARSYAEDALRHLDPYPESSAKNALTGLTEFMVTRNL